MAYYELGVAEHVPLCVLGFSSVARYRAAVTRLITFCFISGTHILFPLHFAGLLVDRLTSIVQRCSRKNVLPIRSHTSTGVHLGLLTALVTDVSPCTTSEA